MRRILIVEDEDILRETYTMILSTQPYDCEAAENGKVALKLCEQKKYDLILLDIMMPVMNGIEFLERYQQTPNANTPVIVLSNLSSGKELQQAVDLGVEKTFLKSNLSPKQMISLVRYELEALV